MCLELIFNWLVGTSLTNNWFPAHMLLSGNPNDQAGKRVEKQDVKERCGFLRNKAEKQDFWARW